MKRNILFFIFFVCVSLQNYAQINNTQDQFYIVYNLEYKQEKDSPKKFMTQVVLLVTDSLSINMDDSKLKSEILMAEGKSWIVPGLSSGLGPITIKNKTTHKQKVLKRFFSYKYMALEEDLMTLENWNITDESKSQLGYATIKAVCKDRGREWEAWFTPEIPISDGPYKFSGLPGLIVALKSTDGDFDFKLKAFSKMPEDQYIPGEFSYELLPEAKFIDFVSNYSTFIAKGLISRGATYENGNENHLSLTKKADANLVKIEIKAN